MSIKFLNRQSLTGFTLIELVVAIGILSTGVVAVQTAIQYGLKNATIASDRIVAAHLAEEGLELIRNIRDSNWAEREAGGGTITWSNLASGTYRLDYTLNIGGLKIVSAAPPCSSTLALNFDNATGLYSYSGGTSSKFRRLITITNNGTNIDVTSQVCWSDNIGPHEITITEHLYDWRPEL